MTKLYTFLATLSSGTIILVVFALISVLLPTSPFQAYTQASAVGKAFAAYLPYINYFLPIDQIIAVLQAWISCVAIWFIWRFLYDIFKSVSGSGTSLMPME